MTRMRRQNEKSTAEQSVTIRMNKNIVKKSTFCKENFEYEKD